MPYKLSWKRAGTCHNETGKSLTEREMAVGRLTDEEKQDLRAKRPLCIATFYSRVEVRRV